MDSRQGLKYAIPWIMGVPFPLPQTAGARLLVRLPSTGSQDRSAIRIFRTAFCLKRYRKPIGEKYGDCTMANGGNKPHNVTEIRLWKNMWKFIYVTFWGHSSAFDSLLKQLILCRVWKHPLRLLKSPSLEIVLYGCRDRNLPGLGNSALRWLNWQNGTRVW
jgi:hypothetical protein